MTPLRAVVAAGAASLLAVGAVTAATAASAKPKPGRVDIAGTHPGWATAKAQVSDRAVATSAVTANVYLAGQDLAGLTAYATEVSAPGSALYGHYLSASQVRDRFAPTNAQITAVEAWLTGAGLTVTKVVPGIGGYVQVAGSATAAAKAFSVTFGAYRLGSTTVRAPEQAASAPDSIASDIISVTGLDTARHFMKPADRLPPPPQNYFVAHPCASYYGQEFATSAPKAAGKIQPTAACGYTPAQIRGAYNVAKSGETGEGVTVAIVDAYASPTMLADANQYAAKVKALGGPGDTLDRPFAGGQYKQVLLGGKNHWQYTAANECDASNWYGEESLDVESVHGMAPDAHVTYVGAVSCAESDLANALAYIVNHHSADIVTNSWGGPYDDSSTQQVFDTIFKAGAAEGIGFFFSSGDEGYEAPGENPGVSDKIQVDFPTSSPWVTAVGGTSLAIGNNSSYKFETSWGTLADSPSSNGMSWAETPPGTFPADYLYSGGGGVSTAYPQPSYQRGVVPTKLALSVPEGTTKTPMRVVPDVSALADPNLGISVGETLYGPGMSGPKFYLSRVGGTSLASPIFAGIEADAQQAAQHPIGFANPAIYALAKTNNSDAFRDVTDHPGGQSGLYVVRYNYADPYNKVGPVSPSLRSLGINGEGTAALPAVGGYDDSTGVGSPNLYIQDFKSWRF